MTRNNRRRLINFIYRYTAKQYPLSILHLSALRKRYPDTNYGVDIYLIFKNQLKYLKSELEAKFLEKGYTGNFCILEKHNGNKFLSCSNFDYLKK